MASQPQHRPALTSRIPAANRRIDTPSSVRVAVLGPRNQDDELRELITDVAGSLQPVA